MNCLECERYDKRKSRCLVFKKKPKNCWAFTLDKDWPEKARKAVNAYRLIKG